MVRGITITGNAIRPRNAQPRLEKSKKLLYLRVPGADLIAAEIWPTTLAL
jgi:hypothetical protein